MKRLTCLVGGDFSGYPQFLKRYALDLRLTGYIESLQDGRIEVIAEGHEKDLQRFLHWIQRGNPASRPRILDTQWSESTGLQGYHLH
ncbi:acylphosphatase [Deinococcus roseus]|uniref:acylphosphatase n=1 Tax=Deinococcus roseus TaxID=392414 RepID=UPI001E56C07B|nr:acylphosphatase [Deinococcus roseus]